MGGRSGDQNRSRRAFFRRLARRKAVTLSLAGVVLLLATAGALAVSGDLTQPAGTAGCVSQDGRGPCAYGHALQDAFGVAVSRDGKSVYVTSTDTNALVRLNRNTTTGAITQPAGAAGCISEDGTGPPSSCADGHALKGPLGVAVSGDGKSVYVASNTSDAVVRLNRNTTTGAIAQPAGSAGCISASGSGGTCANGRALNGPHTVAVSGDGKSVYVAPRTSDAVVRLNRNTTTGAIAQPAGTAGCISETGAGSCADGRALDNAHGVAVSPDGTSVYVASPFPSHAVVRLDRNTTTGAIAQPAGSAGCISASGSGGTCAAGHGLLGPRSVAVSADGKSVYVASYGSDAVMRLNRNTTTGAIAQPAGSSGCVSETGAGPCANGRALIAPYSVAVSQNGRSVYVASFDSGAVARFNRAP